MRLALAETISSVLTWGLRHVAHRPAATAPGYVALKVDPNVISELKGRAQCGSIVVVGTNGKTSVTNLLANVLECSGYSVICNRTGANLAAGVATALLQAKKSDWAVLECDELWSAKVVPQLQPTYFLLLNLFRDQLDRCGEIDHIQDAIIAGLQASPNTTLIYNADDPLCATIASHIDKKIAFGTYEPMGLEQNRVTDATICQQCSHMLSYEFRQYGQLGQYYCENCGFKRPPLDFIANNISLKANELSFDVYKDISSSESEVLPGEPIIHIDTHLSGTYMVYNLLAITSVAKTLGCENTSILESIRNFNPKNGRLQNYNIAGHKILLNLAKNPTGFNQNLRIVEADKDPKAVAFFINDNVVDGHDISWIWDIDFEELANDNNIAVFAGGTRRNDLQVRLKYSGIKAELIDSIDELFSDPAKTASLPDGFAIYAIANYTALPSVKADLDKLASRKDGALAVPESRTDDISGAPAKTISDVQAAQQAQAEQQSPSAQAAQAATRKQPAPALKKPIVIAHILPDLLNLYGDGGNVSVLENRLARRNIPYEVMRFNYDDPIDFSDVDLVVLGGSPDREQRLALKRMLEVRDDLADFVNDNGPLLAICGGYQMLGRTWVLGDEEVDGLNILPMDTRRIGASTDRLIDNIALQVDFAEHPVIGYENHSGRTYLDDGVLPFGKVISKVGVGNNDDGSRDDFYDGIIYKGVIGTYLHGPLLSKNPEVADKLLQSAIDYHSKRTSDDTFELSNLDDSIEYCANEFMRKKLISNN